MERYGASFGAYDDAEPLGYDDGAGINDPATPEIPPSPVGQDERRMQVRAYNHWAALIGDGQFPDISDLDPQSLDDFGPYGVLLDFGGKRGIDDPGIRFIGEKLAEECGGKGYFRRLSDVPGRSLLSRITDHYLQILANKAPIGFEAEFTNDRGAAVLYRGILLPWSSDGETIDFIFGVINWKEMADAATADALLSAIDSALQAPIPLYEGKDMDRMLDLTGFAHSDGAPRAEPTTLPTPAFGAADKILQPFDLVDAMIETDETSFDEEPEETSEWGAGFAGFRDDETVYSVDYGAQGLEDGEDHDDVDSVVDPLGDETASFGLASLVSRPGRVKQSVSLPGSPDYTAPAARADLPHAAPPAEPLQAAGRTTLEQRLRAAIPQDLVPGDIPASLVPEAAIHQSVAAATQPEPFAQQAVFDLDHDMIELESQSPAPAISALTTDEEPDGLYDCLAAARELAQTARSSEDRGRKALYQAVGRAYDFSIEASANPDDFAELLSENGLTVQDRAPMTPIVKLVFGVDYDKTRLTEFATVLGFAHRTGVARGALDKVLASAEGGLKGIVAAERSARKADGGAAGETAKGIRHSLARKLRKLEAVAFADLAEDGPEFALVMIQRLPAGELVVLGEIPEDVALVEKAARKLVD